VFGDPPPEGYGYLVVPISKMHQQTQYLWRVGRNTTTLAVDISKARLLLFDDLGKFLDLSLLYTNGCFLTEQHVVVKNMRLSLSTLVGRGTNGVRLTFEGLETVVRNLSSSVNVVDGHCETIRSFKSLSGYLNFRGLPTSMLRSLLQQFEFARPTVDLDFVNSQVAYVVSPSIRDRFRDRVIGWYCYWIGRSMSVNALSLRLPSGIDAACIAHALNCLGDLQSKLVRLQIDDAFAGQRGGDKLVFPPLPALATLSDGGVVKRFIECEDNIDEKKFVDTLLPKSTHNPFAEAEGACVYASSIDITGKAGLSLNRIWPLDKIHELFGRGNDVRIAVLDFGADVTHSSVIALQRQFKSFVADEPVFLDRTSHGTHCLTSLASIAPGASFFVGKVCDMIVSLLILSYRKA
jgi:hypothetical protein